MRLLPWQPRVSYTGVSIYKLNEKGKVPATLHLRDRLACTSVVHSCDSVADRCVAVRAAPIR